VHGQFFPAPDRAVLLVHENQVFGHGWVAGMTRESGDRFKRSVGAPLFDLRAADGLL
jgi:hypothetical protein